MACRALESLCGALWHHIDSVSLVLPCTKYPHLESGVEAVSASGLSCLCLGKVSSAWEIPAKLY